MMNYLVLKRNAGARFAALAVAIAFSFCLACVACIDDAHAQGSYSPTSAAVPALSSQTVASTAVEAATNHVHVVDQANILSAAAEQELASTITEMIRSYNMDIVIFTDTTVHGCSDRKVYAADFYMENHYGIGSDTNGMEFFICMESGNRGWFTVATGSCRSLITSEGVNYVDDSITSLMKSGDFDAASKLYLQEWNGILANGGVVPGSSKDMSFGNIAGKCVFPAIIVGLIVGFVCYRSKKRKMKTIAIAQEASAYMVSESLNLNSQKDTYMHTTVVRTPRVRNEERGGGASGFGDFSSSGGTSFSGGGRDF